MKMILRFIICSLTIIVSLTQYIYCVESTVINGKELVGNQKKEILEYTQINKITKETLKAAIKGYAVNSNGDIAVLMDNKTINIYTQDGVYLYGYSFKWSGDYAISCEDGYFIIILYRYDLKIRVSENDISVFELTNAPSVYTETIQNHNGYQYTMKTKYSIIYFLSLRYDLLKAKDKNGDEITIIDVSQYNITKTLSLNLLWLTGLLSVILGAMKKGRKRHTANG